jgi:hypothetical protein
LRRNGSIPMKAIYEGEMERKKKRYQFNALFDTTEIFPFKQKWFCYKGRHFIPREMVRSCLLV